ncbi:DUF1674 domain-containing protein [Maricaulis salignorans]|uniref:DUF1674 domain-containing protein n=1 Tax=Maricaulis salignorans TaxID=144026 RepID=A0A1G9R161_9PROT|nr:DUF1674 domain-containing protein [Maricaulis salignorans]SDM16988.1 Protein of unknown function [Maricaulis salignorans]
MQDAPENPATAPAPDKQLTPAAQRALAEAKARQAAIDAAANGPAETGGPKGLEPTRFGDWERKGMASDF